MIGVRARRRATPRPDRTRTARPALEGLEGRLLLYSTIGGQWVYPVRVTYSIVPDGTSVGGTPSNLQQTLGSKPAWQQQIQKAAAAWEAVAGINLVQVPDDGSPIGTSGNQQGDPRFGDIRIGGMSQSGGQLAFAYAPPPFNGGTNAGDIFFNTTQSWQTNGTTYDLMTVAIHEFGHALGMAHSAITTAVMYATYSAAKQALTSDDSSGIQSIYGARTPDRFDVAASNNSSKSATDITPYIDGSGQVSLAALDITTGSDVDWYKVTVPASTTGTMTVQVQSNALSSLVPAVTVYNASLQSAGSSTGASYGDTVGVTASGVKPGQVWYFKAMAGATGPAGVGAYGLLVNFGSGAQSAIAPPNTVVAAQPDLNPTTMAMGTGWLINGKFIAFHQDNGDGNDQGNGPDLHSLTSGSLTGYGDRLEVGDLRGDGHRTGHDVGTADPRPSPPWWGPQAPDGTFTVVINPQALERRAILDRVGPPTRFPDRSAGSSRLAAARLRVVDMAAVSRRPEGLLSQTSSHSRSRRRPHPWSLHGQSRSASDS
jgi:hypothetical protein